MPRNTAALTGEQAKAKIRAQGITITEWAQARGYNRQDVYDVLRGALKAHFGRAHRIAVDLGMKPSTSSTDGNPQARSAA